MGDRAYVEVTLYGVEGHQRAIVELFGDWDGGSADPHSSPDEIHDGITIDDQERSLGAIDEIAPMLEAWGISYVAEQAACYEFCALIRMYTSELGAFESSSDGQGEPLIDAGAIDATVARCSEQGSPALTEALRILTGYEHRHHFLELRKVTRGTATKGEGR